MQPGNVSTLQQLVPLGQQKLKEQVQLWASWGVDSQEEPTGVKTTHSM